jgi:hypothetical protein
MNTSPLALLPYRGTYSLEKSRAKRRPWLRWCGALLVALLPGLLFAFRLQKPLHSQPGQGVVMRSAVGRVWHGLQDQAEQSQRPPQGSATVAQTFNAAGLRAKLAKAKVGARKMTTAELASHFGFNPKIPPTVATAQLASWADHGLP